MPKVASQDYDPRILARTLREFRDKMGLNQAEMSSLVGISKSLLAKLELATAVTSTRTIRLLAEGIGTTESYLMTGKGCKTSLSRMRPAGGAASDEVPDEKTILQILELAQKPDILALAKQSSETLKLSEENALAMIIRTLLLEKK